MILKPFFRKHFLLTAVVFVFFVGLASSLSRTLIHLDHADFFRARGAQILDYVAGHEGDKLSFIRELNENEKQLGVPIEIDVVRDGKSLLTGEETTIPESTTNGLQVFTDKIDLPESATFVVRSNPNRTSFHRGTWITFSVLFLAIVLASSLSIFILFRSFRDKAELAKSILTRMQNGDLRARFPITRLDEAGQIMVLFNEMSDEIQRLVEQLKANESYRIHLMQELTHDLRTPVSSLRNLIETLRFSGQNLQPAAKEEFLDLAYQETEYLTRLVEDLLFLALLLEPKYKSETGKVVLKDIVNGQLSAAASHHPGIKTELIDELPRARGTVSGSEHLIKRMLRNGLENAFSFARTKVEVVLKEIGGEFHILITDDGPGLSEEALANFGKKRSTRYQGSTQSGRISVGLGSVVIQAIAHAHGGRVNIENAPSGGARLDYALKAE